MAKMSADELIDAFKEMTLLELSEFVKRFEEEFDVSAAAPVAAVAAAPAAGDGEPAEEEASATVDVVLTDAGDKKIQVIKEVRGLTDMGLKEAKELVDGPPSTILEGVERDKGDEAKETLEGAGATVELK